MCVCVWGGLQCNNLQANVLCECICKEKAAFSSRPLCWWVTWLLLWMHRATLMMPTSICRRRQIWQERSITLSCTWCSAIWLPSWYTEVGRAETDCLLRKALLDFEVKQFLGEQMAMKKTLNQWFSNCCDPVGLTTPLQGHLRLPENTDLHHESVTKLQLESRSNFVVGGATTWGIRKVESHCPELKGWLNKGRKCICVDVLFCLLHTIPTTLHDNMKVENTLQIQVLSL